MNGMKKALVIVMMLMLTACASGVRKTVYYEYRHPAQRVSVHTTVHRYPPIEVTIYSDHVYRGRVFMPIHLVIADGDYIEIPVKNRKGRHSPIFAHYHKGVLHFDSDRDCHGIRGSSKFKHNNGWHKGHLYSRVDAGKDYDLTGIRLNVRNVGQAKKSTVAQNSGRVSGHDKAKPHVRSKQKDRKVRQTNPVIKSQESIAVQKAAFGKRDKRSGAKKPAGPGKPASVSAQPAKPSKKQAPVVRAESRYEKNGKPEKSMAKKAFGLSESNMKSKVKQESPEIKWSHKEPNRTKVQKNPGAEKHQKAKRMDNLPEPDQKRDEKSNNRAHLKEAKPKATSKSQNHTAVPKGQKNPKKGPSGEGKQNGKAEQDDAHDETSETNGKHKRAAKK